jgi:hypothetical protein
MILRKLGKAMLMIAAGLLACWVARADSIIVAAVDGPGHVFNNSLPAMHSDDSATFEPASNGLFDLAGNPPGAMGLGIYTLVSQLLGEEAFALPIDLSVGWITSFSSLSLPPAMYSQSGVDSLSPGFHDWVAGLPPEFEIAREERMTFFSDLNSPPGDYWDLLREPLASPDSRTWLAELPPAFEMARDWDIEL